MSYRRSKYKRGIKGGGREEPQATTESSAEGGGSLVATLRVEDQATGEVVYVVEGDLQLVYEVFEGICVTHGKATLLGCIPDADAAAESPGEDDTLRDSDPTEIPAEVEVDSDG